MPTRIVVAHPRLARSFRGRVSAWVYADEKLDQFDAIALVLGRETALVQPVQLQAEAARLLHIFIPWADAQIPLNDAHEWILTPCHRNPFCNNLFLHLVWLHLVASYEGEGTVVIFTEAPGLAKTLHQLCRARGWMFSWNGQVFHLLRRWQTTLRACAVLFHDTLRALIGFLAVRYYFGAKQLDRLRDVELLIDTYLYPESLGPDGSFNDKHFPGLLEWCGAKGIRVAVYPFPYLPLWRLPGLFRQMRASVVPMLPFELLISLGDIYRSVVRCVVSAFRNTNCSSFEGLDPSYLVASERVRASMAGLLPMLLLTAPCRLEAIGIKPRWLFDWYENQPIDRANTLGFRRIGCQVVGLRLYVLPQMFASLYTSERQAKAGACPLQAWVGGAAMEKLLHRYDQQTCYHRVPSLRYASLYNARVSRTEGDALLLLLTHSREESLAILSCVLPSVLAAPSIFPRVIIKPHGDFDRKQLRREMVKRWPWIQSPSWLEWEARPVGDLVCNARIVVSAGSSAALEAICWGIPVILIGRQAGLDMNPLIEVDSRLWTVAYDPVDFAQVVQNWVPTHPITLAERIAIGEMIREEYFEPVRECGMAAFDPRSTASPSSCGDLR